MGSAARLMTRALGALPLRAAVLPRGTVTRRPVSLRTTVLPLTAGCTGALRTVAGGALATRGARTLRPVPLRTTFLPAAPFVT